MDFRSRLAAARFWSARRTALLCFPGLGLQLPFSPAAFPGAGSKPGQQVCALESLRRDAPDFGARVLRAGEVFA